MPDFSYLAGAQVRADKAIRFEVPFRFQFADGTFSPRPVFFVHPATKENAAYWAEVRKSARRVIGGDSPEDDLPPDIEKLLDDEERAIYTRTVIKGWDAETVIDFAGGKKSPTEFEPAVCLDFLRGLPPDIWDIVRGFCRNRNNWRAVSVEKLAKNS